MAPRPVGAHDRLNNTLLVPESRAPEFAEQWHRCVQQSQAAVGSVCTVKSPAEHVSPDLKTRWDLLRCIRQLLSCPCGGPARADRNGTTDGLRDVLETRSVHGKKD